MPSSSIADLYNEYFLHRFWIAKPMHELSVCEALLTQVRSTAQANGASGVGRITVRLGPLSGVEPDLLAQAFTIARNGPMTAQANLVIEPQPVRIRCRDCGNENETPTNRLLCAACESFRVDLISGDELLLARVELQGVSNPPNPTTDSKASSDHV